MNARVVGAVALVAAAALAAALMLAPAAQSGSKPGLKMTTTNSELVTVAPMAQRTVRSRCPRGYSATGIGRFTGGADVDVASDQKLNPRTVALSVLNRGPAPAQVAVQALCTKGTGGLEIADNSTGFRF